MRYGGFELGVSGYFLGCPVWGRKDWVGSLLTAKAKPADYLEQYASVFNAVEGNTTFYATPKPEVVARWAEAVPDGFRFCFKLPKTITHERGLAASDRAIASFVDVLEPLHANLGPLMIQLPATFGPPQLPTLVRAVAALPSGFPWAVEVRHPAFFGDNGAARRLDDLLQKRGVDRVLLDTRPIFRQSLPDAATQVARERKPNVPLPLRLATSGHPIVRFIGDHDFARGDALLDQWVEHLHTWIGEGRIPYFFAHCPDDGHAPKLARRFHDALAKKLDAAELPPFPGEAAPAQEQISLF